MYEILPSLIEAVYPEKVAICKIESYRPGYLPYPARVQVQKTDSSYTYCVIKHSDSLDQLTFEARVLTALADLGLTVPQVLLPPQFVADQPLLVMSELPGKPLPWLGVSDVSQAYLTVQLFHQAVTTLHNLTERIQAHPLAQHLPSHTLIDELNDVVQIDGAWMGHALFVEAVALLQTHLPHITTPLVFSNGDYNPLNFLHDQQELSGWLDFEHACFEDPYVGLAKFILWQTDSFGWGLGAKIGLVERFLYTQQITRTQFAPRLILRCLSHLQAAISLDGEPDKEQRQHLLAILSSELPFLH